MKSKIYSYNHDTNTLTIKYNDTDTATHSVAFAIVNISDYLFMLKTNTNVHNSWRIKDIIVREVETTPVEYTVIRTGTEAEISQLSNLQCYVQCNDNPVYETLDYIIPLKTYIGY